MTKSYANCLYYDTIEILTDTSMAVYLGEDTAVCEDDTIAITLDASGFTNHMWSTSESTSSIQVSDTGFYWVKAENGYGCESSDTIHITSYNCYESIEEINNLSATIFPNPATDHIFLAFDRKYDKIAVELYSIDGRFLSRLDYTNLQVLNIPLSTFEPGIYIAEVTTSNSYFIGRFTKQ